eukprot:scpid72599/ scgid17387/ 
MLQWPAVHTGYSSQLSTLSQCGQQTRTSIYTMHARRQRTPRKGEKGKATIKKEREEMDRPIATQFDTLTDGKRKGQREGRLPMHASVQNMHLTPIRLVERGAANSSQNDAVIRLFWIGPFLNFLDGRLEDFINTMVVLSRCFNKRSIPLISQRLSSLRANQPFTVQVTFVANKNKWNSIHAKLVQDFIADNTDHFKAFFRCD